MKKVLIMLSLVATMAHAESAMCEFDLNQVHKFSDDVRDNTSTDSNRIRQVRLRVLMGKVRNAQYSCHDPLIIFGLKTLEQAIKRQQ